MTVYCDCVFHLWVLEESSLRLFLSIQMGLYWLKLFSYIRGIRVDFQGAGQFSDDHFYVLDASLSRLESGHNEYFHMLLRKQ